MSVSVFAGILHYPNGGYDSLSGRHGVVDRVSQYWRPIHNAKGLCCMTDLLERKSVEEIRDSKNCIYLLDDEDMFSQLGHKVLLSRKVPCLLNVAKIRYNGQTELIYLTEGLQNYLTIMPTLPRDGVYMLCAKVMESVLKVKNQGFLAVENLDISMDKVYFDPKTYEAYLVYLPLSAGEGENGPLFEAELRHLLLQFVKQSSTIISEQERCIVDALTNGTGGGLEGIAKIFQNTKRSSPAQERNLQLISMNTNLQIAFAMRGQAATIGRRKGSDLTLDFSNQISRLHCTLKKKDDSFYIKDEGSSFGTGLNGKKIPAMKEIPVKNGDVLMLPGIKFKINIR